MNKEYVKFFDQARPYQRIDQKIHGRNLAEKKGKRKDEIIAFPVFNGLHHAYRRAA